MIKWNELISNQFLFDFIQYQNLALLFMKQNLKGVLKYIGVEICNPSTDETDNVSSSIVIQLDIWNKYSDAQSSEWVNDYIDDTMVTNSAYKI